MKPLEIIFSYMSIIAHQKSYLEKVSLKNAYYFKKACYKTVWVV